MKNVSLRLGKISRGLAYISCVGVFLVAIFVTVDVLSRYIFNQPILGSYEIIEVAMSVVVFSSFAYTETVHGHVNIVMVVRLFPEKLKMFSYALMSLLSTFVAGFTSYSTLKQAIYTFQKGYETGILGITLSPFYLFGAICMCLFSVVLLCETIQTAMGIFNHEVAVQVEAEWS